MGVLGSTSQSAWSRDPSCHTALQRSEVYVQLPYSSVSSRKLRLVCAEEEGRLVTSIAPVVWSPRCWPAPGEHSAGVSAGKTRLINLGVSTVCFHHDQKIWKDRKNPLLGQEEPCCYLNATQQTERP